MHVGWGEIKAAGPERPPPLSLDAVTFIPLPTSSLPADLGLLSCQKRRFMEKFIALHSYLMGGGREDEHQQPQAGTWEIPAVFPDSCAEKSFSTLRVKHWTGAQRGGGISSLRDVQSHSA